MRRRSAFTLIELLVAVAMMGALVLMAQATYVIYMRDSVESTLRQNLFVMRSAIQQFYSDHGRYPYDVEDSFGNRIGFLDTNTSELTQGVRSGPNNQFPKNRVRYLMEIPVDPTTNQANWRLIPYDGNENWNSFSDNGVEAVSNDFNAGEGNGIWDEAVEDLNDDCGEKAPGAPCSDGGFGRGDGRPNRGENNVDEDPFSGGSGTDPFDVQDITSANKTWEHL